MSKIILCCPFFNENLIANLNIEEASKWVDEIHVTEFDKSFKYKLHEHCFHNRNEKVYYHPMDASKLYKKATCIHSSFFSSSYKSLDEENYKRHSLV